ncbi:MAG: hypothetical protein E6J76_08360 [Deltaproteobacteria bacterium]|nr:MAG: hypothetical protein E6J76_08360 [Deltaproteobacteria bacterium]
MARPLRRIRGLLLVAGVAAVASRARGTVVETMAGGAVGDGLPATEVSVQASGVATDGAGNVYLSDRGRLRRVDAVTGLISTIAGPDCEGSTERRCPWVVGIEVGETLA